MDKKLIFFDIDGTLVDNHARMSKKIIDGLREVRNRGHMIFICTGRNMASITQELKEVDFDGLITSAGGHIVINNQEIYNRYIDHSLLDKTIELFKKNNIEYNLESTYHTFMNDEMLDKFSRLIGDVSNSELERLRKMQIDKFNVTPINEYYKQPVGIHKICFIADNISQLKEPKEHLIDKYNFVFHSMANQQYIHGEIIFKEISKGIAIKKVVEYLNMDINDTIGFGDSMNDYEMIDTVNYGVVMNNGSEQLKRIADKVCLSVQEDGVYYELKELGLI